MTYPVILLEMKEGYSKLKCKMMRNKIVIILFL